GDDLLEDAILLRFGHALGEGIGVVLSAAQTHRPDGIELAILLDAAAPELEHAFAVGLPVPATADAAFLSQVEALIAEGVAQQDVIVVARVVQAPVAGGLLHLEAAVHAR